MAHAPDGARAAPFVEHLAEARPAQTVFTRFTPAKRPGEGEGTWASHYGRWRTMTLAELPADGIELVAFPRRLVPLAEVFDERIHSPWTGPGLHDSRRAASTRWWSAAREPTRAAWPRRSAPWTSATGIVLLLDRLCSSSDEAHDALLTVYRGRYGQQVEIASTTDILRAWRRPGSVSTGTWGDGALPLHASIIFSRAATSRHGARAQVKLRP